METEPWKEKILRCYKRLVIDTDLYRVVDDCVSEDIFTLDEREEVETNLTQSNKNRQFLRILLHKSEETYKKFLTCLTTEHAQIKSILEQKYTSKPLKCDKDEVTKRRQIFRKYDDIVKSTSLKDFTDDFISQRVFGIDDWESIANSRLTTIMQNQMFLDILLRKEFGYSLLLSLLKTSGYSELASQIKKIKVKRDVDEEINSYLQQSGFESKKDSGEISLDKLMSWKEDDETFSPTRATEHIYNEAVHARKIIVAGLPGSGKSANIHHIALRLKTEGYRLCSVQGVKQMIKSMDKFGKEEKQVYVIDDIFGVYGVNEKTRKDWSERYKDDIARYLRFSNIILLCSSRIQVIQDETLSNINVDFTIIDISQGQNELSSDEQVAIFTRHAKANQRHDLMTKVIAKKIRDIECPIGCFPLVCRLFTGDAEATEFIEEYFSKPLNVVADHLQKLRTEDHLRHFCLLMCLIYDNKLPVSTIEVEKEQEETKTIREELLEICELLPSTTRPTIKKKMDTLLRTFLKREGEFYYFAHDIIHDAIIKHVGQLSSSLHKVILRHCTYNFVYDRVRLSTVKCDSEYYIDFLRLSLEWGHLEKHCYSKSYMNIKEDVYPAWGCRIFQIIQNGIFMSECFYQESNEGSSEKYKIGASSENPWFQVFCGNPCLKTEEGDKIFGEVLSKKSRSDVEAIMCTLGYSLNCGSSCRNTALHWAAANGLKHVVIETTIAVSSEKLQEVDSVYGLIGVVCDAGHDKTEAMIQVLVEHGADVNKPNDRGRTPLWISVNEKDYQTSALLVRHGADVNQCSKEDCSPLYLSVYNRDYQTTKLLLQNGADVNMYNCYMSPLWQSVFNSDHNTTELLVKHGADVNQCDMNGTSLLYCSLQNDDYQTIKILAEHGADIHQYNDNGLRESSLNMVLWCHDFEKFQCLLQHCAEINHCDQNGMSPLYLTVFNQNYQSTEFLIKRGADVNLCGMCGQSPLYLSVYNRDYEISELLLRHGADVHLCDIQGKSPLHISVWNEDYKITELLLKHGADVNMSCRGGSLPLFVSVSNHDYKTTELLAAHDVNVNQYISPVVQLSVFRNV